MPQIHAHSNQMPYFGASWEKKNLGPVILLYWVLTFQGYQALLPEPTPHTGS